MTITLFVSNTCPQAWAVRQILQDYEQDHLLLNVDEDAAALATLHHLQNGQQRVPTLILPNGTILIEPSWPVFYQLLRIKD
jgi:mycoredoxin